jgi:hypothetical protein
VVKDKNRKESSKRKGREVGSKGDRKESPRGRARTPKRPTGCPRIGLSSENFTVPFRQKGIDINPRPLNTATFKEATEKLRNGDFQPLV